MPKTRQQKQAQVEGIVRQLRDMKSGVISAFTHVKVKDERTLRARLKAVEANYQIVKKNLLALAMKELNLAHEFLDAIRGTIVITIAKGDAVAPVKEMAKFAKSNEKFVIQAGFLSEGAVTRVLSKAEVVSLSALPSREELIARVVGSIGAPLSGMVNVLSGNLRGLVQVLGAIQKSKS